jgi:PBP superfamily domain
LSLDPEQDQPSADDGEAVSHQILGTRTVAGAGRAGARRALALVVLIPAAVIALAAGSSGAPPAPVAVPGGSGVTAALPAAPDPAVRSLAETGSTLLYPLWNDPAIKVINPGLALPAIKVIPLHRSDGSGDTFLFTSYLSTQDPGWSGSVSYGTTVAWPRVAGQLAVKGNSGMVTGCAASPGCVAYIGISYLGKAGAAGLGEAALLDGSGSYELPTPATINAEAAGFAATTPANGTISLIDGSAAGAYPIVNYEYAIVSTRQPSATQANDLKALLNWILTTGSSPKHLDPVKFQPLPSQVASISHALAAQISS